MQDDFEDDELEEELDGAPAEGPGEGADPDSVVQEKIPPEILAKYEVHSYRSAAIILSETHPEEFSEILSALRSFSITTEMIRKPSGNESDIPKEVSALLRPNGWHETTIQGDLLVRLLWKEQVGATKAGKLRFQKMEREFQRIRYIDGHKIDYVKGRVAFDLEWNSKDQTFDRDLYAFRSFAECGAIDVGILLTRSADLNPVFRELGPFLKKMEKLNINLDPLAALQQAHAHFAARLEEVDVGLIYRVTHLALSHRLLPRWCGIRRRTLDNALGLESLVGPGRSIR